MGDYIDEKCEPYVYNYHDYYYYYYYYYSSSNNYYNDYNDNSNSYKYKCCY